MKHERLKILEMLDNGKITADEAARLLQALKTDTNDESFYDGFYFDHEAAEERIKAFAKDFSGKVQNLYKDVEPKIKKASNTVLEKTAKVIDELAKSLHESLERAHAESCGQADCGEPKDGCCSDGCCGEEYKNN
ncbi:MAG: hypothetical protein FWE82_01745 [Defluviitaleaceae bacterium]|nr:hypothetical protein [Defluviitaleaceae bacterium]